MFIPRVATTAEARLQPEFDRKNAEARAALRSADEVLAAAKARQELVNSALDKVQRYYDDRMDYLLEDFVDHDFAAEHATDWSQRVVEPDWSQFGYA
jgi:hypothetical protein